MKIYTIFFASSLGTVYRRVECGGHKGLPFVVKHAREFSSFLTGDLYPGEELKYTIYDPEWNDVWHEFVTK